MTTASPVAASRPRTTARPKPCGAVVPDRATSSGIRALQLLQNLPGPVRAAVVDHDDLVRDAVEAQLEVEVLHGRGDAALLVPGGNDDREFRQRWKAKSPACRVSSCRVNDRRESPSQSGMASAWSSDLLENGLWDALGRPAPGRGGAPESSTIHGMSKDGARARRRTIARGPKRSSHQALSCRSEIANARSARDVDDARPERPGSRAALDERDEIGGMEAVPHLVALAVEADVAQGPLRQSQRVDPVGEDPLVRPAELAGAGEHAAAVDPDRKAEGAAVLEGQLLAARAWWRRRARRAARSRSSSVDPCADARRQWPAARIELESLVRDSDGQCGQAAESSRRGWCSAG